MQGTDPYFQLFRGLLSTLAWKGVIDAQDAKSVVEEAMNFAEDNGDLDRVLLLAELEKLMADNFREGARRRRRSDT